MNKRIRKKKEKQLHKKMLFFAESLAAFSLAIHKAVHIMRHKPDFPAGGVVSESENEIIIRK